MTVCSFTLFLHRNKTSHVKVIFTSVPLTGNICLHYIYCTYYTGCSGYRYTKIHAYVFVPKSFMQFRFSTVYRITHIRINTWQELEYRQVSVELQHVPTLKCTYEYKNLFELLCTLLKTNCIKLLDTKTRACIFVYL